MNRQPRILLVGVDRNFALEDENILSISRKTFEEVVKNLNVIRCSRYDCVLVDFGEHEQAFLHTRAGGLTEFADTDEYEGTKLAPLVLFRKGPQVWKNSSPTRIYSLFEHSLASIYWKEALITEKEAERCGNFSSLNELSEKMLSLNLDQRYLEPQFLIIRVENGRLTVAAHGKTRIEALRKFAERDSWQDCACWIHSHRPSGHSESQTPLARDPENPVKILLVGDFSGTRITDGDALVIRKTHQEMEAEAEALLLERFDCAFFAFLGLEHQTLFFTRLGAETEYWKVAPIIFRRVNNLASPHHSTRTPRDYDFTTMSLEEICLAERGAKEREESEGYELAAFIESNATKAAEIFPSVKFLLYALINGTPEVLGFGKTRAEAFFAATQSKNFDPSFCMMYGRLRNGHAGEFG